MFFQTNGALYDVLPHICTTSLTIRLSKHLNLWQYLTWVFYFQNDCETLYMSWKIKEQRSTKNKAVSFPCLTEYTSNPVISQILKIHSQSITQVQGKGLVAL